MVGGPLFLATRISEFQPREIGPGEGALRRNKPIVKKPGKSPVKP